MTKKSKSDSSFQFGQVTRKTEIRNVEPKDFIRMGTVAITLSLLFFAIHHFHDSSLNQNNFVGIFREQMIGILSYIAIVTFFLLGLWLLWLSRQKIDYPSNANSSEDEES